MTLPPPLPPPYGPPNPEPYGAGPPGQPYPQYYPYPYGPPPQPTNTMAIVALVLAFVIPPLGIIFGHIALSQIKRTGEQGRTLAIVALVIGYVTVALWLIVLLALIIIGVIAANQSHTYDYDYYGALAAASAYSLGR